METPQSLLSSRTVEWQSSQLNALTLCVSLKVCPFCCGCPLAFVHVSIIICTYPLQHVFTVVGDEGWCKGGGEGGGRGQTPTGQ